MRCILSAICLILFSPLPCILGQEHYGRWQFEDLGQHLPIHWDAGSTRADFSGLAVGWIGDIGGRAYRPWLFDVHTGELVELERTENHEIRDLHGTQVLTHLLHYDHATGARTDYDWRDGTTADAMNADGQVALGVLRDVPLGQQRIIRIEPTGVEFVPPWEEEIAPGTGIFVPASGASYQAWDFAGDWIGGSYQSPDAEGGFIGNAQTGEVTILPPEAGLNGPSLLNEHGQALLAEGLFWDGSQLTDAPTAKPTGSHFGRVLTSDGQIIQALQYDENDGTVLGIVRGPVVRDASTDWFEIQTHKLVVGTPLHIAGDYNGNGRVAQGDLDLILLNWNTDARPDRWVHDLASYSGRIDQAELDRVLLNWGSRDGEPVVGLPESMTTPVGVPEPATWILAIMLAVPCSTIVGGGSCGAPFEKSRAVLRG